MEYPNYYGILPAAVRYAKIPDRAKILFSEITALALRGAERLIQNLKIKTT